MFLDLVASLVFGLGADHRVPINRADADVALRVG